jgi:hypothetical protein
MEIGTPYDLYSLSWARPALVIRRRAGFSQTRATAPSSIKAFSESFRAWKESLDPPAASRSLNGTPASPCRGSRASRISRTVTLCSESGRGARGRMSPLTDADEGAYQIKLAGEASAENGLSRPFRRAVSASAVGYIAEAKKVSGEAVTAALVTWRPLCRPMLLFIGMPRSRQA